MIAQLQNELAENKKLYDFRLQWPIFGLFQIVPNNHHCNLPVHTLAVAADDPATINQDAEEEEDEEEEDASGRSTSHQLLSFVDAFTMLFAGGVASSATDANQGLSVIHLDVVSGGFVAITNIESFLNSRLQLRLQLLDVLLLSK